MKNLLVNRNELFLYHISGWYSSFCFRDGRFCLPDGPGAAYSHGSLTAHPGQSTKKGGSG